MKHNRRQFIRISGITGLGLANAMHHPVLPINLYTMEKIAMADQAQESIIGAYGNWAASLTGNKIPLLSFRNDWADIETWRSYAKKRLIERMAIPDIGPLPDIRLVEEKKLEDLLIQDIEWILPHGNPVKAYLVKPYEHRGKLPGILAFHDHGGNKFFGREKITYTGPGHHSAMKEHQDQYYGGRAWANELARRGYVVLVPDAFTFGSRRVLLSDVPAPVRQGLEESSVPDQNFITRYNQWASQHESIMAKSLFSAGTTWPGVFFAEDLKALDLLCSLPEVNNEKIGCAGLSGGGLRTVFMGGLDSRITCCVCVGFMTTWKDLVIHKSYTHTWMTYVPVLPNELEFAEILGLRAPLPSLVMNNNEDSLFTLEEMQHADSVLANVYQKAGAPDHYKTSFYPGPHKFDVAMQQDAFAWFDRWLKN